MGKEAEKPPELVLDPISKSLEALNKRLTAFVLTDMERLSNETQQKVDEVFKKCLWLVNTGMLNLYRGADRFSIRINVLTELRKERIWGLAPNDDRAIEDVTRWAIDFLHRAFASSTVTKTERAEKAAKRRAALILDDLLDLAHGVEKHEKEIHEPILKIALNIYTEMPRIFREHGIDISSDFVFQDMVQMRFVEGREKK